MEDSTRTEGRGPDRGRARELARAHLAAGDALGWFEVLYGEAARGEATVPWVDLRPNPILVEWLDAHSGAGRALVVGCGMGDDAGELASRGYSTVGFDLSCTAIAACSERFASADVEFLAANLLDAPESWRGAFDLVVESYTLQVLPPGLRAAARAALAGFVKPSGTLLVIARARDEHEPEGEMPWPLTRGEVEGLGAHGLELVELRDFMDDEEPPARRFRATFQRA